jgi:hypothetical protein
MYMPFSSKPAFGLLSLQRAFFGASEEHLGWGLRPSNEITQEEENECQVPSGTLTHDHVALVVAGRVVMSYGLENAPACSRVREVR